MSEPARLIDTSTLSYVMRGTDDSVQGRARAYLRARGRFTFSILTRFEILRGLHAKGASRQIERFEHLCAASDVLPLTDPIVVESAKIYGSLRRQGELIDDMDILIAASALVNRLGVITENADHFRRIPELRVESWRSG